MDRNLFSVAHRDERIHVNLSVTLRVGGQGCMDVPASLLDLSERGAKVRATVPLRLGQDVEVKVGSQDAEARNYRVVWVRGDPMARQPAYDAGLKLCR